MSDDTFGPGEPHRDPESPGRPGDDEPTQPITGAGWTSPSQPLADPAPSQGGGDNPVPVSPVPPQQTPWGRPPAPTPHPAYLGPAAPTAPMPQQGQQPVRREVPRWIWPLVAGLSLLLGLTGGFLGAWGYQRWDDGSVTYGGGLDSVHTQDAAPLAADNGSIPAVAQALLPSTVQIIAAFGGEDEGATGSGFVLDREGHVVTNNHVVSSAVEDGGPIKVVDSEGVRHVASVVGRSPVYDLAILLIEDPEGLEPAALGTSSVLRVGDPVIAFGAPLGLSQTVTSGIVSAMDRPVTTGDEDNISSYINAVQTDAAINPGNSGGPLVNLAGEVVGVNSAIATTGGPGVGGGGPGNIGVGFAIPIEQVRTTADQILKTGEARYPVIGAKVQTGGADSTGAVITEVNAGTPADDAGLRPDDVVTEVDGKLVSDGIALIVAIRTHQPGETIAFTLRRAGQQQEVEITLGGEIG